MAVKMKPLRTPLIRISLAALLAANAFGGGEAIVKERAKELNNQNNVRQGAPPPASQPAAPAPTPATPSAMSKFQTDLAAIATGSILSTEQKQLLTRDLLAMAQGAKPSPAAVSRLAEKLAAACAEKQLPAASRARLAVDLDAILNPAKYPQAKWDAIYADIQAIFQDNSASRKTAMAIAEEAKTVAREIQGGGAK
jgi:hypothetical protein